jgi:hypothetical protein
MLRLTASAAVDLCVAALSLGGMVMTDSRGVFSQSSSGAMVASHGIIWMGKDN